MLPSSESCREINRRNTEFRADDGNVKFVQTRSELKRSEPSPTRSQPKEIGVSETIVIAGAEAYSPTTYMGGYRISPRGGRPCFPSFSVYIPGK